MGAPVVFFGNVVRQFGPASLVDFFSDVFEVVGGWELSKFATKINDVEVISTMHGYGVGSSGGKGALFEYRITRGGRPPWWRRSRAAGPTAASH